jgi:hypothetical protein
MFTLLQASNYLAPVQCIVHSTLTCLKSQISDVRSTIFLKRKSRICHLVRNVLTRDFCVQPNHILQPPPPLLSETRPHSRIWELCVWTDVCCRPEAEVLSMQSPSNWRQKDIHLWLQMYKRMKVFNFSVHIIMKMSKEFWIIHGPFHIYIISTWSNFSHDVNCSETFNVLLLADIKFILFHYLKKSWVAAQLMASQEGLSFMNLV